MQPPPPPPRGGGGGGVSRNHAKHPGWGKKKSSLSGGFVLTISVGDQHRFSRSDQGPPVLDEVVERLPLEIDVFLLVNREQVVEEVLLLTRGRTELARQGLLHAEPRLICTAARLMRIEVGHGRESVEQGLAIVSRTPLKQLGKASDRVEGPRRHTVGIGTSPTSEQGASVRRSHGNLVGDLQRLLELSSDSDELVDGLFHVLNLGKEVLGMADLETKLASSVTHHHLESVGANDAGRGVDPVEVGAAVDAVEEAEAVLELAVAYIESVEIGSQLDGDETAAAIIDRASRFDDGSSTADSVLDDFPEATIGESLIRLGDRNASGFAVVAATEVAPAFQRSVVGDEQRETLNLKRESVVESDNRDDLRKSLPSHFKTGLNVASFNVVSHSVFSFCNVLWLTDGGQSTGCGGILQAGK